MKTLLFKFFTFYSIVSLTLFFSIACQDTTERPDHDVSNYSVTQKYLFKILDDYKSEYNSQKEPEEQSQIQKKYLEKLEHLLVHSLRRTIDSMAVTVDTIIEEGRMVTTKFHTRDIEFKYGMVFRDSMDSKSDSLYKFMRGLKPNQEITVNFIHLGTGELNNPNDTSVNTIRIFAYPSPLNF